MGKKPATKAKVSRGVPMASPDPRDLKAGDLNILECIERVRKALEGPRATVLAQRHVDANFNRFEDGWSYIESFVKGLTADATARELEYCVVRISEMHTVEFVPMDDKSRRSREETAFVKEMLKTHLLFDAVVIQKDGQGRLPHQKKR
jgi:hypothetical protein